MKKIIALILALTMCAFVLVACDDDNAADSQNPNEATNTTPAETEPPVPVKVNDLNGKTPKQLWEAASAAYPELNSFELYLETSQEETEDGVTYKWVGTQEAKISGNNLYFKYTDSEYENNVLAEVDEDDCGEVTVIDGVGYVDDYEGKFKYAGDAFEAIAYNKDNIAGTLFEEVFKEVIPVTALEGVELYQLGDEYYFDGTTSVEGSEIKFSARFDKNGLPTELGIEANFSHDGETAKTIFKVTNINKPITITAPADAASYPEFVLIDPDGLTKLQAVAQKLAATTNYSVDVTFYGSSQSGSMSSNNKNYAIDADGDSRIETWNNGNRIAYYNKGTAYYTESNGNVTADASQNVKDMFAECSAWKNNLCAMLQVSEVKMLKINSNPNGPTSNTQYRITVMMKNGDDVTINFYENMTEISVSVYSASGNSAGQNCTYSFRNMNTGDVQINVPTVG